MSKPSFDSDANFLGAVDSQSSNDPGSSTELDHTWKTLHLANCDSQVWHEWTSVCSMFRGHRAREPLDPRGGATRVPVPAGLFESVQEQPSVLRCQLSQVTSRLLFRVICPLKFNDSTFCQIYAQMLNATYLLAFFVVRYSHATLVSILCVLGPLHFPLLFDFTKF